MFYFNFMSGNLEIGNGYGVPGGGAYYGAPVHNGKSVSIKKWLSLECLT